MEGQPEGEHGKAKPHPLTPSASARTPPCADTHRQCASSPPLACLSGCGTAAAAAASARQEDGCGGGGAPAASVSLGPPKKKDRARSASRGSRAARLGLRAQHAL